MQLITRFLKRWKPSPRQTHFTAESGIANTRAASRFSPELREQARDTLTRLYAGVDGYGLSFAGRTDGNDSDKTLTYGEILLESFILMMDEAAPKPGEVFYDLGSGLGKVTLMAHLLYPFRKAAGIELLPTLHAKATEVKENYERELRPTLTLPYPDGEVVLYNGDMREVDFTDADVIFAHGTCFSEELCQALEQRFALCKPGTRFVLPSGLYYERWMQRTHELTYPTAWQSEATCYIYRRT